MSELGVESLRELNNKLKALERDIADFTKATSSTASRRFDMLRGGAQDQYARSSKMAKEYVTEHPAQTTLVAAVTGLALGLLAHMLWRKSS